MTGGQGVAGSNPVIPTNLLNGLQPGADRRAFSFCNGLQRGESQPGVRVAWAARAARRWIDDLAANQILDTLIADKKALPMIVVMPNGRSSDEPVADPRVPRVEMQAYAAFEKGTDCRPDSVHRVALFGAPLARAGRSA